MKGLDGYEEKEPKSMYQRLLHLLVDWKKKENCPAVEAIVSACERQALVVRQEGSKHWRGRLENSSLSEFR